MGFISEFMQKDHAYLDQLWADFLRACENREGVTMFEGFRQYEKHLVAHFRFEDEFLFPQLAAHLGFPEKDVAFIEKLHGEHVGLLKILAMVAECEATSNTQRAATLARHLDQGLQKHRERESQLQYEISDRFIEQAEWEAMLAKTHGTLGVMS